MPFLVPLLEFLLPWIMRAAGWVVVRVLMFLGITAVTITGVNALMSNAQSMMGPAFGGLGAVSIQLVALAGLDKCISIMLSAYSTLLIVKGVNAASGSFTRWNKGGASI